MIWKYALLWWTNISGWLENCFFDEVSCAAQIEENVDHVKYFICTCTVWCSLLVRLCTIFFCDHCNCFFIEYLCFLLGLLTSSSSLNQFLYQSNLQSRCWLLTLGYLLLLLIINGAGNYRLSYLYCNWFRICDNYWGYEIWWWRLKIFIV